MENAYGTDLAYIHDAGYNDLARDAARRLVEELARVGCREGTVVDLGCGSGILARHVLQAGYGVVGVDMSDAMVALARKRAPGAKPLHGAAQWRLRPAVNASNESESAVEQRHEWV